VDDGNVDLQGQKVETNSVSNAQVMSLPSMLTPEGIYRVHLP
jgi:hypothetical protein